MADKAISSSAFDAASQILAMQYSFKINTLLASGQFLNFSSNFELYPHVPINAYLWLNVGKILDIMLQKKTPSFSDSGRAGLALKKLPREVSELIDVGSFCLRKIAVSTHFIWDNKRTAL